MTEAAESGERAARAALDDAMSLNVEGSGHAVQRRLDRLPRGPWRQKAKAQPRELWRQGVPEHSPRPAGSMVRRGDACWVCMRIRSDLGELVQGARASQAVGAESVLRPHAIGSLAALLPLLGPHAIVGAEFLAVVVWVADIVDRLR